jgi:diguanylate cyclase (GGDEF)-like protein/PAS domain S-box-containing protein
MSTRRIATRLLLGYLLVAVLPLAGLAAFYLASFERSLRETVLANLATVADKKAEQIDTYMADRLGDTHILSERASLHQGMHALARAYQHGGLSSGAYRAAAASVRATVGRTFESEDFYDLLLIDPAGNVVFSMVGESDLGTNLIDGPYRDSELAKGFALTMQTLQTNLSRFARYPPSGNQPAAFLLAPMLEAGIVIGAVALQLDVGQLEAVTADRTGLGRSGETLLAHRVGDDAIFTAPLRHVQQAAFNHRIPLRKTDLPIQRVLKGEHGHGFVRDYAGVEVVSAWRYLPSLDWGMVVKIDADEALAPMAPLRRITYTALAVFLLISGLAALYLGRGLSRPIRALTEVADRISTGDLSQRAAPGEIEELDRLAVAFNHMTKALAESRQSLETQVEVRSQELRAATTLQNAILDNAGALVVVLDHEGRIRRFNRACETLTQYGFAEVEGKTAWDLFLLPEEREAVRTSAFLALTENPDALRGSYTNHWVARDGTRRLIEWSNSLLLDERGRTQFMISVGTDVTDKAMAAAALMESEKNLNKAQRIAQIGSWELDLVSGRLIWSDEIYRLFEIDKARFGASYEAFLDAVHPDDRERVNRAYSDSLAMRTPYEITHRLRMADGRVKWVNERGETQYDGHGHAIRSSGTVQDITVRKLADESLRLYASVFEHSGEAILITDQDRRIVAVNRAFTQLTGYTLADIMGKNPKVLSSGETPPETYLAMWTALDQAGYWQGEIIDRRKDGTLYPKWLSISAVREPDGSITHYIGSFTDISERKKVEAQISQLAYHDGLTEMLNRIGLQSQLDQALAMAGRDRRELAVIFLDVDRFKTINDTMGHAVGDKLLVEAARRLRHNLRNSDIVARFGGDEFVVVLTDVDDAAAAARVADKILRALATPYLIDERELHSTASIGIAFFPGDGNDADTLLKNADTAMYHAKSLGRNNLQFFTAEMNQAAVKRLTLDHELRVAMEGRQFVLHYQPQLDGPSGRPVAVEALVRWQHPRNGLLAPSEFISVAEETGLILQLGEWVLDEACRQLRAWRDAGLTGLVMAVNLSAHQLRAPTLVPSVADVLKKYALSGSELELEVTESVAMHDPDASIKTLKALRDLGVRLSIDDFGTGYSSLSYLKLLPIQALKLDKSFVRDIETDSNDVAICTATIALAHSLNLSVVAEGVETEAQRLLLASHHCDYMQGYLFSRPLPAEAVMQFIRSRLYG